MKTKTVVLLVVALAVAGALAWWISSSAETVTTATIVRGRVREFVEEEGKTRVAERFLVSAPVSGRLLRIELEEGDRVKSGDVVAEIEDLPFAAAVEAARARIRGLSAGLAGVDRMRPKPEELERAGLEVERAKAAEELARREKEEADAAAAKAHRDAERARDLFAKRTIPESEKEDAELAETRTRAALRASESAVRLREIETRIAKLGEKILAATAHDVDWREDRARAEIDAARADLTKLADDRARTKVAAPVSGTVLRRMRESEAVVPAGAPILEVGSLTGLTVEADLLSEDAARMAPGLDVEVFGRALGERTLDGTLDRIRPAAFTKISALGVEQQRTTVIVKLANPPEGLGDRYRVDVRVILTERPGVLLVPESALFREGGSWYAFRVVDGEASLTKVETGIRDGRVREVLSGLSEDDTVVTFPPDSLTDGARVEPTE